VELFGHPDNIFWPFTDLFEQDTWPFQADNQNAGSGMM